MIDKAIEMQSVLNFRKRQEEISILIMLTLRKRGLKQNELAKQMGVGKAMISRMCSAKHLSLKTIAKLELFLGTTLIVVPDNKNV